MRSGPSPEPGDGPPGAGNAAGEPTLFVLGPLRLRGPAGDVRLGGARPRRILAALAVRRGESFSADRLIDIVWGQSAPPSARDNLHTYLWMLRRLLQEAPGGALVIESGPAGYVLDAAPGALDWDRFGELTAAAARYMSPDPAMAGRLLRQALVLWRGSPAADVADGMPQLAGRFAAMEEARMTALEQRIEADLRAGLERDALAELTELVAAHPLREQLRAHQMVALYRCGRRAEALSEYHRLRHELASEFGVDPSPRLCALFEAMLHADPSLSHAEPAPRGAARETAAGVPVRHGIAKRQDVALGQLAARDEARTYQGRRAELARMLGMLAAPGRLPRVVRLHGPAGIGKTAFVHALARKCASRGWPAVILDSRDFRHDAAALCEAVTARCAGNWSPGDGRPLLLAFDTFEEMADVERDLWDIVLPGISGPVLVMLSGRHRAPIRARQGYWRSLVEDLELPGLSSSEARRLAWLHEVRDPDAVGKIVAFAAGNPLLLVVSAQHARQAGLRDADLTGAARSLIGRMTREIADPGLRELVGAASLVRTFNQELLAEMTGRDVSSSFGRLCGLSFVRIVSAGARLHDLVRESVAADLRWPSPVACQMMRRRACAYLTQVAATSPEPGPYAQELLHLAAASSPRARFYAQSDHPGVRVRMGMPGDLPRLIELCQIGISRFGLPASERIAQLSDDFELAQQSLAVALDERESITGFAYVVELNTSTWRAAARTRSRWFATLPEPELAAIKAAAAEEFRAVLVTGATHLPGHDHVNAALREALFASGNTRRGLGAGLIAYHLLTEDCLELPDMRRAGITQRVTGIPLGDCVVDEWVLRFGKHGIAGWTAEALGFHGQAHA